MPPSRKQSEQVEERVKAELARNPLWQKTVFGQWLCPYCGSLAQQPSGAPKFEAVRDHLVGACPAWQGFRGQYIPLKTLQNKTVAILMSHCLTSDPAWKIFDEGGQWYCPYCVQAQAVPRGPSEERAKRLKGQIKEHLSHCQKFDWGKGKSVPLQAIKRTVDRANLIKRLQPKVAKVLNEDPRWQGMAVDGSWICPFCEERLKNIDVSSQLLRRETAPLQVANHLLRYCSVYQKVQIRDKDGNLKPPEDLIKVTDLIEQKRSGSTDVTRSAPREKTDPGAAPKPAAASPAEGVKLAAEGFALSINVERDDRTTWDALSAEEGAAVNSELEAKRLRTPAPPPPAKEPVKLEFMDPEEVAVAEPAPPAAPAPPVDDKTRIQRQAFQRSRRHLLEMTCPIPQVRGYEFGAVFKPSDNLDGDFFYFFDLGGGRHAIATWEISRSGMDMVPINRHVLEALSTVLEQQTGPKAALCRLNEQIYGSTDKDTYIGVLLVVLDTGKNEIVLANAGFQPLIIYNQFRNPDLTEVRTNGIVLGSDDGALFKTLLQEQTIPLQPQDLLVFFSQGVVEFQDAGGRILGLDTFKEYVRQYGRQDPSYFLSMTDAEYKRALGGQPLARDLTIVCAKQM